MAGRRVIVIGSHEAAARRIELLAGTGADVVHLASPPDPAGLDGAFLVLLCEEDAPLAAALDARARRGEFLLACIDSDHGAIEMPAVVRRGLLQVAVSTAGAAPGLAARLRAEMERVVPESAADFVDALADRRAALAGEPTEARRAEMLRAVEGVRLVGRLELPLDPPVER